jgi:asparagine synthase (glutamine-hydrolysing)
VSAHLLADVEVGLFLSSGVDSAAILALMRDAGQKHVTAITLAFDEFRGTAEDESVLAAKVAANCDARHIVRYVSRAEYEADLPLLLDAMDQPSIDGVNTWFVSKAAREAGLKVALSGLGGDELLGGYSSFEEIPRWTRSVGMVGRVPGAGRLARWMVQLLKLDRARPKAAGMVEYASSYEGAYLLRRGLMLPFELSTVLTPEVIREGLERCDPLQSVRQAALTPPPPTPFAKVSAMESSCYMRNQLLRDGDWAGMAHSLEIRTPLVDIRLLEQVAPYVGRLGVGEGKRLLANSPVAPLADWLVQRPKTGFVVPTEHWATQSSTPMPSKGAASRRWARTVANAFVS